MVTAAHTTAPSSSKPQQQQIQPQGPIVVYTPRVPPQQNEASLENPRLASPSGIAAEGSLAATNFDMQAVVPTQSTAAESGGSPVRQAWSAASLGKKSAFGVVPAGVPPGSSEEGLSDRCIKLQNILADVVEDKACVTSL